jgi:hypothetical protein
VEADQLEVVAVEAADQRFRRFLYPKCFVRDEISVHIICMKDRYCFGLCGNGRKKESGQQYSNKEFFHG